MTDREQLERWSTIAATGETPLERQLAASNLKEAARIIGEFHVFASQLALRAAADLKREQVAAAVSTIEKYIDEKPATLVPCRLVKDEHSESKRAFDSEVGGTPWTE